MLERVTILLAEGRELCTEPPFRYALVERAGSCLARRNARLLAWGFGPEALRLVVRGAPPDIAAACGGLKNGTRHALLRRSGGRVVVERAACRHLVRAVAWAHRGPVDGGAAGPLASPWSSHRDLLCFRRARFYDAGPLRRSVDGRAVHVACGGAPLPEGWPPPPGAREDLTLLLRIAAAVLGVLPADRRCFRLFVHLARARGWSTAPLARALALTRRRVRQLAAAPEPDLSLALIALSDRRLGALP